MDKIGKRSKKYQLEIVAGRGKRKYWQLKSRTTYTVRRIPESDISLFGVATP